jgi:hypothetical protein
MDNKTQSEPISDISSMRGRLRVLHQEQLEILHIMMDCGPMIVGSLYQTYRSCSYPNCRCHKGEKHGPFPAISYSVNGKHKSRPIRQDDVLAVQKKTQEYHRFQKALTRWRAVFRESEVLLEKIREICVEYYQ